MTGLASTSRKLYDVMEMVGASETLRRLHQRTGKEAELLHRVENKCHGQNTRKAYICGSSFEGSVTPDLASDYDLIDCLGFYPIVTNTRGAPRGPSQLIVRDPWTYPGYVKLQYAWNGQPLTVYEVGTSATWDVDYVGRVGGKYHLPPNPNGPAIMHVGKDGKHFLDHVPAYKYEGIPWFANGWIARANSSGWPPRDVLEKLQTMGCMVVGTGHGKSPEKFVEWRLSFTPQERILMASLNPVQHKVYILLKMIKKNILEKSLPELVLSSYHMKTCVLYAAAWFPSHVWTRDNLLSCVFRCIKLLSYWVKTDHCPNFFVEELNLFSQKRFKHQKMAMLTHLQRLCSGNQFLNFIQTDNIASIMKSKSTELFRSVAEKK